MAALRLSKDRSPGSRPESAGAIRAQNRSTWRGCIPGRSLAGSIFNSNTGRTAAATAAFQSATPPARGGQRSRQDIMRVKLNGQTVARHPGELERPKVRRP
jgi:hypothetical protein